MKRISKQKAKSVGYCQAEPDRQQSAEVCCRCLEKIIWLMANKIVQLEADANCLRNFAFGFQIIVQTFFQINLLQLLPKDILETLEILSDEVKGLIEAVRPTASKTSMITFSVQKAVQTETQIAFEIDIQQGFIKGEAKVFFLQRAIVASKQA